MAVPKKKSNMITQEQAKLALSVYLEEYRSRTTEGVSQIELSHNVFALTLTGIGAILTASPFLLQEKFYIFYGLVPFLFYGFTLTQIRHRLAVMSIDDYLNNILKPNMERAIDSLGPTEKSNFQVLLWAYAQSRSAYVSRWWLFPVELSRDLISIVAGLSCCGIYIYLLYPVLQSQKLYLSFDFWIIVLNLCVAFYTFCVGILLRSIFLARKKKASRPNEDINNIF